MSPAELSSEKMDWQTPEYFLDLVRAVDTIALDPCAPAEGNPTGAIEVIRQYLNEDCEPSCGLSTSWKGLTSRIGSGGGQAFVNPPYGPHLGGEIDPNHKIMRRPDKHSEPVEIGRGIGWARKIVSEASIPRIALVPARPDAEWWEFMLEHADETLLWRSPTLGARLKFRDARTGLLVQGNTSPSTVFYFGPEEGRDRFRSVFRPHGNLITLT